MKMTLIIRGCIVVMVASVGSTGIVLTYKVNQTFQTSFFVIHVNLIIKFIL